MSTFTSPNGDSAAVVDAALEAFSMTGTFYGSGFVNHGPMVVETLEHLSLTDAIPQFFDHYVERLEQRRSEPPTSTPGDDWASFVRDTVGQHASDAAALAGHGLLRTAHAVRALIRHDTQIRRHDLADAVQYWGEGRGVPTPPPAGEASLDQVMAMLPRRAPVDAFLISDTLEIVARDAEAQDVLAQLAKPTDHATRLQALGLASCDRFLANGPEASFAFIHLVTVPTMAQVLLPYLTPPDRSRLVHAVTGFVLLAVVAYDDPHNEGRHATVEHSAGELAGLAAASLDDHTIKFTDACLTLSALTDSELPLVAAQIRCKDTRPS